MADWLMIMAYVIGGVGSAEILGPSVLAIFNSSGGSWTYVGIATGPSARATIRARPKRYRRRWTSVATSAIG